MPENPEVPDKVDGEVFVTHIDAISETIRVQGIEEPIYLLNDLSVSKMIGTGPAKAFIQRDDDGDLVMSKYEALSTVPTVPAPKDMPYTLAWAVIGEARRQLGLATNRGIGCAGQLLDSLLAAAPDAEVDLGELVNREGGLMENVVYHAVNIAAGRFNPDPADPGWISEMHEDFLRDACLAYVLAFLTRRKHGS